MLDRLLCTLLYMLGQAPIPVYKGVVVYKRGEGSMKKNTLWAMIKIIGWILLGVLATGLIIALYAASRFFGSGFF